MASLTVRVDGIKPAVDKMTKEVFGFLVKVDDKYKVAGIRWEAYAKAKAPVDTGFHRRNIRHDPGAPFLTTEVVAAAEYASVLEEGFDGIVIVRAHYRKVKGNVLVKAHTVTRRGKTYTVKAHTRKGTKSVYVSGHFRPLKVKARPHIIPARDKALKELQKDLKGLKK